MTKELNSKLYLPDLNVSYDSDLYGVNGVSVDIYTTVQYSDFLS